MPREGAGSIEIIVGGTTYKDVLSMNLRRSRNEATSVGTIVMSWPGTQQFNRSGQVVADLKDGADGEIKLDGQRAAKIIIDTRISKGTPKSYELTLNWRGFASTGVDGGVKHKTGQFNKMDVMQLPKEMLKGTGINIIDQTGGFSRQVERFIIAYGETIERAVRRATREFGITFYENKDGDWVFMGPSGHTASGGGELRLGNHFTQWQTNRNLGPRYPEIKILGNKVPSKKNGWGKEAESPMGEEFRELIAGAAGILPAGRFLPMLVDGDHDKESLERRTKTEANRRAGMALNVQLTMSTWVNDAGVLWDVDQVYKVIIPIDEIEQELIVDQVEFELTPDTRNAKLTLVNKDATSTGAPSQPGETSVETRLKDSLMDKSIPRPGVDEEEDEEDNPKPPPPSKAPPPVPPPVEEEQPINTMPDEES